MLTNYTGKVADAEVIESYGGDKVFKFVLNHDQVFTMKCPTEKDPGPDKVAYDLFLQSERQGWSIYHLVGKYLTLSLWDKKYQGHYIHRITSLNAIKDFKELLENSFFKPFTTPIDMYWILKGNGYKINDNNSITLKGPYQSREIIKKGNLNICYPGGLTDKHLNFENINDIFEKFYKGKPVDIHTRNSDTKYYLTDIGIYTEKKQYHRRHARVERVIRTPVFSIGQVLTEEQINYLESKKTGSQ